MKLKTSLGHLHGKEQMALHHIKKILKETCNPLLLYLYNSKLSVYLKRNYCASPVRTTAHKFECSLLMVTEQAVLSPSVRQQAIADCALFGTVSLKVLSLPEFINHLQVRNKFCCWVQKQAMLLLGCERAIQQLPPPISNHREYRKQMLPVQSAPADEDMLALGSFDESFLHHAPPRAALQGMISYTSSGAFKYSIAK